MNKKSFASTIIAVIFVVRFGGDTHFHTNRHRKSKDQDV